MARAPRKGPNPLLAAKPAKALANTFVVMARCKHEPVPSDPVRDARAVRARRRAGGARRPADRRHPRQFRPRRVGSLFQRRGQGRRLWQVHASPPADVGRQADDYPDEPRYALFGGGVRPRCGSGDDHPARSRQALPVDAGDRRRRVHPRGPLWRRGPHPDQGPDRNALRPCWRPHPGQSRRSQGRRDRPRAAGRDRGQPARRPRKVHDSQLGRVEPGQGPQRPAQPRRDGARHQGHVRPARERSIPCGI